MKKTLLTIAALIAAASSGFAQMTTRDSIKALRSSLKTQNENELKPRSGFSTELNINPFKGQLSLNNSLNQIKFRIFTQPDFAWRIGFNASSKDSLIDNKNPYGTTNTNYKNSGKRTTLGLNIGFEKHFKGTKRLSPYIGADVSLTNRSAKQELTNGQTTTTYKGAWVNSATTYIPVYNPNTGTYYQSVYTTSFSEKAFFQYGLNVVTGVDFYMAKNFFVGYELSFGIRKTEYKDVKITQTGSSTPISDPDTEESSFSFGPSLMNGIRIGYVF